MLTRDDQQSILYSVVIPTYSRLSQLGELLKELMPQIGLEGEVIVTDDARCVETANALEQNYSGVQVVQGPARGVASNRNAGVARARGDWIIFLDDDVIPDRALIDAYVEQMNPEQVDVLEGRTYSDADVDWSRFEAPVNLVGGNLWSCNFAILRKVFEGVGGFAEVFRTSGGEDIEFHTRLRAMSARIKFIPSASVYHAPRRRPGVINLAKRWHGDWVRRILERENPARLLALLPMHIVGFGLGEAFRYRGLCNRLGLATRSLVVAVLVACMLPWWYLRDYREITRFRESAQARWPR